MPADIKPGNYSISIELKDANDSNRETTSYTMNIEVNVKVIEEEVKEENQEEEDTAEKAPAEFLD